MRGRLGFLLFMIGLLLGALLRRAVEGEQLPVRMQCAPAGERI